ncbi:MAG: DUF1330 domain-containing protein, partial [Dongiaceae bacterium]
MSKSGTQYPLRDSTEKAMPAYMIADNEVLDPERFAEYRRQVLPTVEKHGGRFIARAGPTEVLEGAWRPH